MTDARALGVAQEAVVRSVHGLKGSLADAVERAGRAVRARGVANAMPTAREVREYVMMVTYPRTSDEEVLVARPGFQMTYGLTPLKRETPVEQSVAKKRANGKMKVDDGEEAKPAASMTLSVMSVDGGRRGEASAPPRVANGQAANGIPCVYSERLEAALEKTLKSAEWAEEEQSKLEELTRKLDDAEERLEMKKKPTKKMDLSDMPDFTLSEKAQVFKGNANDRKELLNHRKWVEQEITRLNAAKAEWIADRRARARNKAKRQSSGLWAEVKKLKREVAEARSAASKALAQASADAQQLDTLRSRAATAQQRQAEAESRRKEKQALREKQKNERLAKRTQEQIERDERKAREKELRLQEIARKKEEATRYPMEDEALIAYDAVEAKEQGRDPWPPVASGVAWNVSVNDVSQIEICEFCNTFGTFMTPKIECIDTQRLREVLDDHTAKQLSAMYESLLRVAVTSVSSLYKNLVELWVRGLDSGTYPEIIRQYAKVKSRIGIVDEKTMLVVDSLKDKVIGELTAEEHTTLLLWLCAECLESQVLNQEVDRRLSESTSLRKKRQREDAQATEYDKEYKKSLADVSLDLNEARELVQHECTEQSMENQDAEEAQSVEEKKQEAKMLIELEEKHILEQERRAEIENERKQQNSQIRVRAACLGQDRNCTRYYWKLANDQSAVIACSRDGTWSKFETVDQLNALEKSLNEKGIRERRLAKNIRDSRDEIVATFQHVKFEQDLMFPKTNLRLNSEAWTALALRETLATESIRHNLSQLARDLLDNDALAPDGTSRGWSLWLRDVNREERLSELIRFLFQVEEAIVNLSPSAPKKTTREDGDAAGAVIERAIAQVRQAIMGEGNFNVQLESDYDWWELIIPSDGARKRSGVWNSQHERSIWRDAIEVATNYTRVAYGTAMLVVYSRDLFESMRSKHTRSIRDASRHIDYAATARGYD
ncbi:unnamed product [Ostreococcus tauri]|uniref:Unnamed product n=2 Tax=Ostreococcus tauri TaxID=70448 RepID=A0A090M2H4_OSTTA|nr:unnamed product [Ostreococcus tauri]CEF96727.1 unnamed product [Ostreococcus tauri]|eukprot:XP_003074429.2 unnamed product [Ostreococcus tauri]